MARPQRQPSCSLGSTPEIADGSIRDNRRCAYADKQRHAKCTAMRLVVICGLSGWTLNRQWQYEPTPTDVVSSGLRFGQRWQAAQVIPSAHLLRMLVRW